MQDFLSSIRCFVRGRLAAWAAIAMLLAGAWALPLEAQKAAPRKGMPRAQKHESRQLIDQLEDKWCSALLKADVAALQGLLADDYTGITAYGTLQSKDETLTSLRTGVMKLTTLEISDRKVRFYGATALVTSEARVEGVTGDGPVSGDYRYSHVYIRDAQGAWKIVNFEASHVRHPR